MVLSVTSKCVHRTCSCAARQSRLYHQIIALSLFKSCLIRFSTCARHPFINVMELNLFFFSKDSNRSASQEFFFQPKGSSRCSHEPCTFYYPDTDKFGPQHPTLFLLSSILTLSSHIHLGPPSGLFLFGFPTKIIHACPFALMPATCPANQSSVT
jgi:hypothetical protein